MEERTVVEAEKYIIRYFSKFLTGHIHKLWRGQRKGPGQESWYGGHYPLWVNDTGNMPKERIQMKGK